MSSFSDILPNATSFASSSRFSTNTLVRSGSSSSSSNRRSLDAPRSPRSGKSGPGQQRRASQELAPLMQSGKSPGSKPGAGLSSMSQQRKGGMKAPGLSAIIQKGFDAFNVGKEAYKSIKKGFSEGFSKEQLAPLHRNFSDNPERAARQEAFVNKYMPHLKGLSAIQSGMEKVARGMLGIPDKPKKAGQTQTNFPDIGKVDRKVGASQGFDSQDLARQAKHMDFIKQHVPALSPLISMQQGLQKSFQKLMGMPTKTPDLPTMGQKIDSTQTANTEEKTQRSPLERNFSNDPERAARQKAFVDKYMPHVAALSKLQSSMENMVRGAIKGPKDSSVDPKAGVGATS